jgi:hypothetical protein
LKKRPKPEAQSRAPRGEFPKGIAFRRQHERPKKSVARPFKDQLNEFPGFVVRLVVMSINTVTFAARDFWRRQGASDEHTLQGSVRSEL